MPSNNAARPPQPRKNKKKWIIIALIVLLLGLVGYFVMRDMSRWADDLWKKGKGQTGQPVELEVE